jgi:hypothetical protein
MTMLKTLKNITARDIENDRPVIQNHSFVLKEDCQNAYHRDNLETIPAGTEIVADFAGDFGMYGMVEVAGVLHKVQIELHELHKIDFGPFDARN